MTTITIVGDTVTITTDAGSTPPSSLYALSGEGPPVDGATGAGIVAPGQMYLDIVDVTPYINRGTLEAPVYKGMILS